MKVKKIEKSLTERWDQAIKCLDSRSLQSPYGRYSRDAFDTACGAIYAGRLSDLVGFLDENPSLVHQRKAGSGTLLGCALGERQTSIAAELLSRGAWNVDNTYDSQEKGTVPFAHALDFIWMSIAKSSMSAPELYAIADGLERSGRPNPNHKEWALICFSIGKFSLCAEICDMHSVIAEKEIVEKLQADPILQRSFLRTLISFEDTSEREACWALVTRSLRLLDNEMLSSIWRQFIGRDKLDRITFLIYAGAIPQGWTLPPGDEDPIAINGTHSLLATAGISGSQLCFEAFLGIQEAVDAAIANPSDPKSLSKMSVQNLAALARLGVDISVQDAQGRNVLHHWAIEDRDDPRDGWITIGKINPVLLEVPNKAGVSAAQAQRDALCMKDKKLNAFNAAVSRAGQQALRKSVTKKTEGQNPPSQPKRRL